MRKPSGARGHFLLALAGAAAAALFSAAGVLAVPSALEASGVPSHVGDISTLTVSGISSGGFMAVQLHVAFSSLVRGAAVVAGGPYFCSNDNAVVAQGPCMKYPDLICVPELLAATAYAETLLSIDSTSNLRDSKVWLFSGLLDHVVDPGVVDKLLVYYRNYVDPRNINSTFTIPAVHSWVTDKYGGPCGVFQSPFIVNCGYDTAGHVLEYFYGELNPPATDFVEENLFSFDQSKFVPAVYLSHNLLSLAATAYVYIPTACQRLGSLCRMHVSLHGCEQTTGDIGLAFVSGTKLNEWAETNDIVVLYPQIQRSALNPYGCFDWWSYSGLNFATKLGGQIQTIYNMISFFAEASASLPPLPVPTAGLADMGRSMGGRIGNATICSNDL